MVFALSPRHTSGTTFFANSPTLPTLGHSPDVWVPNAFTVLEDPALSDAPLIDAWHPVVAIYSMPQFVHQMRTRGGFAPGRVRLKLTGVEICKTVPRRFDEASKAHRGSLGHLGFTGSPRVDVQGWTDLLC